MAISIKAELDKISKSLEAIGSVGGTLKTDRHISAVIKAAHNNSSVKFIDHMTAVAVSNPRKFSHMYEWDRVGDPNARLWKHILKGNGKSRNSYFEFKASRSIVPVPKELARAGVQKRHIFYWKAPVLEYGLPVNISPKVAKYLVYLDTKVQTRSDNFRGFKSPSGVVYRSSPVHIRHAGNKMMWNSFTEEYITWWNGNGPRNEVDKLIESAGKTIGGVIKSRLKEINTTKFANKSFSFKPSAFDPTIAEKLQIALKNNYAKNSLNRVIE